MYCSDCIEASYSTVIVAAKPGGVYQALEKYRHGLQVLPHDTARLVGGSAAGSPATAANVIFLVQDLQVRVYCAALCCAVLCPSYSIVIFKAVLVVQLR